MSFIAPTRSRWMFLSTGILVTLASSSGSNASQSADDRNVVLTPLECSTPYLSGLGAEPVRGIWLAGDTHVHDDHSSDGSLPRQESSQTLPGNLPVGDQIGQAERTGLDYVPLTDHRTYDQHWDPQYGSSKLLLIPGEEANGSPHAIVLGAPDVIVDGANPSQSAPFRHVQQSVWDAHTQGAIWSQAHPDDGESDNGVINPNGSVVGANTVEILNVASNPDAEITYAEDRWNHGFRFGVTAASDDHFREVWDIAGPGRPTTFVFAAERSEQGILDALRVGHTTISNGPTGPFVTINADVADGHGFLAMGGDEVLARSGRQIQLRIHVQNAAGTTLYVFRSPGKSAGPLATYPLTSADQNFVVSARIPDGASWYRAEVRSSGAASGLDADPTLPDQLRAATSPIFVSTRAAAAPVPEIAIPPASNHADHAQSLAGSENCLTLFGDIATAGSVGHVVAEAHVNGRTSVIYQQISGGRGHDEVFDLTPGSQSARFPRVATSGRDVWVVWQGAGEGVNTSAVFIRHSADAGEHWSSPVQLSDDASRANHPAIAVASPGHPIVVWSDRASGPFDVRAQILGVDSQPINLSTVGKTVDPGISTDARSPHFPASLFPSVAVSSRGKLVVAWQDDRFDPDPLWTGHTPPAGQPASGGTDPDNWEILASVRTLGNGGWQSPVRVSANDNLADRHPSIVADRTGAFVVGWDAGLLQSSGVNLSIMASRSADGGQTWSAPANVALQAAAMSERPHLDVDAHGTVHAVWYDSRSADWRWQIFTSQLSADLTWSPAVQLTGVGNGTWPAVSDGMVVFTSDRQESRVQRDPTEGIFAVRAY
jgi:hypothetical protein